MESNQQCLVLYYIICDDSSNATLLTIEKIDFILHLVISVADIRAVTVKHSKGASFYYNIFYLILHVQLAEPSTETVRCLVEDKDLSRAQQRIGRRRTASTEQ